MSSSKELLQSKRFLPLLLTKISAVFNDNFFKNALVFGLLYSVLPLSDMDPAILITLSAGLLILPFFLFSALAGQIADKFQKDVVIRHLKFAEIAIALLGINGLIWDNPYVLLAALFLLAPNRRF